MPPARAASQAKTRGAASAFGGWTVGAVEFFAQLEVENTKAFWTAHKDLYRAKVLTPMETLLAELAPEFGEGRIFRPYRDVRFSKDKSPYKTNIAASNGAGYISLNASALGVGAGLYMPTSGQLARFRAAIDNDDSGEDLVGIVAALEDKDISVHAHETLKTAPRGYSKDHPRIELLQHKGLTAWKEWPIGAWLGTSAAKTRIVEVLRASAPLRQWLETNVGMAEGY